MDGIKEALKKVAPVVAVECHRYYKRHGRPPNLIRPSRFSEKVVRRKLFSRNPLYSELADKFKVRAHVARIVGEHVLVPLVNVTADPDELLKMEGWARKVIKPNHGAMMIEIIPEDEPSPEEKIRIVEQCRVWLRTDFSTWANERHYASIKRRILVEEFVGEPRTPVVECKIHCFPQRDGSVAMMGQLISDRFNDKSMSFYLGELSPAHQVRSIGSHPPNVETLDRSLLENAVEFSQVLSRGFSYVRVDWMLTADRLYFSELTFTPGAGLSQSFGSELDRRLCDLWVL